MPELINKSVAGKNKVGGWKQNQEVKGQDGSENFHIVISELRVLRELLSERQNFYFRVSDEAAKPEI